MGAVIARRPRTLLALLLVVATLVFLGGVLTERAREEEHRDEPTSTERASEDNEAGEAGEGRLFGVNAESPVLVFLAAGASLALALALLRRASRPLLLLVAGFALLFAVFDAREVVHQLGEACVVLAVIAALAALLHLGATVIAGRLGQRGSPV